MADVDPIREVVRIAGRLLTMMNRETELLQSHQSQQIGALQDEKSALTLAYATLVRQIRSQPELVRALAKAVRDEMRETLKRFEKAARDNARAIEAARLANERVIHAIVEAATLSRPQTAAGYGANGARPKPARPDAARPVSVAFNREL